MEYLYKSYIVPRYVLQDVTPYVPDYLRNLPKPAVSPFMEAGHRPLAGAVKTSSGWGYVHSPLADPSQIWQAAVNEENQHLFSGHYRSGRAASLRLFTSPDDPITLDNTRSFLAAIARTDPPWFIFALVGTKPCV